MAVFNSSTPAYHVIGELIAGLFLVAGGSVLVGLAAQKAPRREPGREAGPSARVSAVPERAAQFVPRG